MATHVGASEADWEEIALDALGVQEWRPLHGPDIAPGTDNGRPGWDQLTMPSRLLDALRRLNPQVPAEYLQQACAEILAPQSQDAMAENYRIHQMLTGGYRGISYIDADGTEQNPTIRLAGSRVEDNELLAVNQVILRTAELERRFDIVVYLNGMPVAIFELKRAGSEQATLATAHAQIGTYVRE